METLARSANRGSISTGYDIDNSLKFERDNAERMSKVITSTTNQRTWTWSGWVKRSNITNTDNFGHILWKFGVDGSDGVGAIRFMNDDTVRLELGHDGASTFYRIKTNRKFRDTSAWYHLVLAVDTTQATDTNRVKFYVNGVQETSFSSSTYPPQNFDTQNNYTQSSSSVWVYGGYVFPTTYGQANFYLAETNHIDGSQLAPTDFGEFDEDTGIWKPIEYTGSYGTNGWYLNFSNSSALGEDFSGNNLDWTTFNNITSADQATDTPTNNFCTLNVLSTLGSVTYTQGATVGTLLGAGDEPGEGTMTFTSGKWYYEASVPTSASTADAMFGFGRANYWGTNSVNPGGDTYAWSYHSAGRIYYNNNNYESYGSGFGKGDIVSIAIDVDNTKFYVAVNGTWQNSANPAAGTGGWDYSNPAYTAPVIEGDSLVPAFRIHYNTYQPSHYNFGGYTVIPISSAASDGNGYGNFEYAPPSGYYALCTKNLAEFG